MKGGYDLFKLEKALEAMKSGKNNPSKLASMSAKWVSLE